MKQTLLWAVPLLAFFCSCTDDRDYEEGQFPTNPEAELIHYWNFNTVSGTVNAVASDYSAVGSASITYAGSGDGYMDDFDPGYATNARNGDAPGNGIRARNPSNARTLDFELPTTGYSDVVLKFATARTSSGATTQMYSYSIDGTTFITTDLAVSQHTPFEDPQNDLVAIDFASIPATDNNPNFKFRIQFAGDAAAATSGNNRFDNVTLEGVPASASPGENQGGNTALYLFHYWHFNAVGAGTLTSVAADETLVAGTAASITYTGTGAGYMDTFDPGSNENTRNAETAGQGIRMRNPSYTRDMLVTAPTTGYKNVVFKFATAKSSSSGAATQNYSYTVDGINFTNAGLATMSFDPDIDPAYQTVTLDFSGITSVNNNPNFAVKISFTGPEAAGTSGNDRFDNLTFEGNLL